MKKYALIANNDVLYTVASDSVPINGDWREVLEPEIPYYNPSMQELVQSGWTLTDTTVVPNFVLIDKNTSISQITTVPTYTPPTKNTVPLEIPLWKFRSVLTIKGIAPMVSALIDALPEPDKTIASVQWDYGNYITRTHPLIIQLGSQLGLSTKDIDDIFIQADSLT